MLMRTARGLAACRWLPVAMLAGLAACGGSGGSSPTAPVGPSVAVPIPAAETCGLLGGTAIYNGAECPPETSSVVLIQLLESQGFPAGACSGTVIAPRVVLSAAHCLSRHIGQAQVSVGGGLAIVASSFVAYPGYAQNNPATPDVGLIFFPEDLPRRPVPLLTSRDARVGETAVIAGWGRDQDNPTATLRAGSTTISRVGTLFLETPFNPPLAAICSGDSGGPLLLEEAGVWAVAGVSSATTNVACNTGSNFYVAIRNAAALAFVLEHVPGVGRR
jgi:hypothetical protein